MSHIHRCNKCDTPYRCHCTTLSHVYKLECPRCAENWRLFRLLHPKEAVIWQQQP